MWLAVSGCAATLPPPVGLEERRLTAADPRGFYTVAVEHADLHDFDAVAAARDRRELQRLWKQMGLAGAPPPVDLATHVVVAFKHRDDGCLDELTALRITSQGHLVPELSTAADECELPLLATVHVAAVARVALPPAGFVFEWQPERGASPSRTVVKLDRNALPPHPPPPPRDPPPRLTGPPAGVVDLPAAGAVALARLDDGSEVYVVHHQDGAVSVLGADRPAPLFGVTGLRQVVRWSPRYRRFEDAFDEYGVPVFGRKNAPLERYQTQPVPGEPGRLRVGRRVPGTRRLLVAPMTRTGDAKPLVPYRREPLVTRTIEEAQRMPDGSRVLVDASLVFGAGEPPTLCSDRARTRHSAVCPPGSPRPTGVQGGNNPSLLVVLGGPLLVTVARGQLAEVTLLGTNISTSAVHGPSR